MSQPTPLSSPAGVKDGAIDGAPTPIHGLRAQPAGPSVHTALGLERHDAVAAAALAAVLGDERPEALTERLEADLGVLWETEVAALPAPAIDARALLDGELTAGDALWLTAAMAARHTDAVRAWRASGVVVDVVPLAPERLAERLAASTAGRVWLLAEGLEGRSDAVAPFAELGEWLARYPALHLLIDDAGHMGWCGRGGRGRALAAWPGHERVVVVADLGVSFGAEVAVVASARPGVVERARDAATRLDPSRLGAALAVSALHAPDLLDVLQRRLAKRLQVCDSALRGHRLRAIAPEGRPQRFVAVDSPRVAYEVAARLLAQGHFVSAAVLPGHAAALRFPVTLAEPREALLARIEAIARELKAVAPEAIEAAPVAPATPAPHVTPIDFGTWRQHRARSSR